MELYRWQRVHIDPKETKDAHENRSLHKSGDQQFTGRGGCRELSGPQACKGQNERHQGQWAWRRSGERDDQDSTFRKIYTIKECSQFAEGSETESLAESRSEPKKVIENCNAIAFTRVMSKWSACCVMIRMDKVKERKTWSRHMGGVNKINCQHLQVLMTNQSPKHLGWSRSACAGCRGWQSRSCSNVSKLLFEFNRRLRQGNVEAPQLWQIMAAQLFASVEARWTQKKMGLLLDFKGGTAHQICSFMWTDNFSIMSHAKRNLYFDLKMRVGFGS